MDYSMVALTDLQWDKRKVVATGDSMVALTADLSVNLTADKMESTLDALLAVLWAGAMDW